MKHKNHKKVFHISRLGLFSALLIGYLLVHISASHSLSAPKVLGYSTQQSQSSLLDATNLARSLRGLKPLQLNEKLESSAQAKANDMAKKDYWSHVSPDGTQPWSFIQNAGYRYQKAGENLAYGFSSSRATVDGWMSSETHRANILGDYSDVGFGFIDAPVFQGKEQQTIVVAHYGSLQTAPAVAEKMSSGSTGLTTAVQTGQEQNIPLIQLLGTETLPVLALIGLAVVISSSIGFVMTHRIAFKQTLVSGEHFVFTHPGVDTAIVGVISSLILFTTYAHVG